MGDSPSPRKDEAEGLDLLEEHDAAPEISQLLNYGQHQDDPPQRSMGDHLRIARLSVIQTVALSVLLALIGLAAVYFALWYHANPAPPPAGPAVHNQNPPVVPANPQNTPTAPTTADSAAILPATPAASGSGIQCNMSTIEAALQGPAAEYIAWLYSSPEFEFCDPPVLAFQATVVALAECTHKADGQRLIAFTDDGQIRWQAECPDGEYFSAIGGSDLYAVAAYSNHLRGYDGWGKVAWDKEFPIGFTGKILSGTNCSLYAVNNEGVLYCFAPHGDVNWTYDPGTHQHWNVAPLIDHGVLLASSDGVLHKLNSRGQPVWRKALGINGMPVRGKDGCIFAGNGKDMLLYKLDAQGSVLWQVPARCGGTYFAATMLPLDDGGVIVAYDYPGCYRYDADGNERGLCRYTGVSGQIYKLDDKRLVIPTRSGELQVYSIDGEYDYSLPLDYFGKDSYVRDGSGMLYMIAHHQVVAVKPLP